MNETTQEFKPSRSRMTVDEAVKEAVHAARENNCRYVLTCWGFQMLIDSSTNVHAILESYWDFQHERGVENGSIVTTSFNWP